MPSSGGPYSHGTLTEAKRGTWPAAHAGTMPNRPLAPAPAPTRPAPDWTTRNRVTTDFPLVTLERQEAGWTVSGILPPSPSMPVGAQKLRPPEWCTDPGPASGEAFTHSILRPAWVMQNFTDDHVPVINGTLTVPSGGGSEAFVDAADIAAVAVETLLKPRRASGRSLCSHWAAGHYLRRCRRDHCRRERPARRI